MVKAEREPVWEALGTDWGSVLMGGFQSFEQDGCLYFASGMSAVEGWVEILGSEYDRAKAAHTLFLKSGEGQQLAA
jgi:hypothetical protein